eukprot:3933816-Rhodomonas_salina.1
MTPQSLPQVCRKDSAGSTSDTLRSRQSKNVCAIIERSSRTTYLHHRSLDHTRTRAAPLLKVIVTVTPAPLCRVSPPA